MKSAENPYNPGSGKPPPELAGRASVIGIARAEIERAKAGKPFRDLIVTGLRGVGKTVLLVEFEKLAERMGCQPTNVIEADYGKALPQLLVPQLFRILVRLDRVKRAKQQAEQALNMLRSFASAFKVKLGDIELQVTRSPATGDLSMDLADLFVETGTTAQAASTAVVVLLDEVQCLSRDDLSALIMALHKISQRQLPVMFIGAGLPMLPKLAGEAKSYAERMFHYERIGPLDKNSATAALAEPAKAASVAFTKEAIAMILEETQGYAYYLQEWGKHAWNAAPSSPIGAKHIPEARTLAITSLDTGIFNSRFERMTERQLEYARAMAELQLPASSTAVASVLGLTPEQTAQVRDELIKKGMTYPPRRGLIDFTIPLFGGFLKRRMPDVPKKGPRSTSGRKPKKKTRTLFD
jgi:hypothetical protein